MIDFVYLRKGEKVKPPNLDPMKTLGNKPKDGRIEKLVKARINYLKYATDKIQSEFTDDRCPYRETLSSL
jgi:hypothetical protein